MLRYVLFALLFYLPVQAAGDLTAADSLFEHRNDSFDPATLIADSAVINQCIRLYEKSLQQNSDAGQKEQAVWKLLQAFYFKGLFTTKDIYLRRKIYTRGIEIAEKYQQQFPRSVAVNCWMGILWGYWGEVHSKIAAARKGIPGRVRTFAEQTIALDDAYLDAGGYRMLGRLNFKVPKIPPFINWPSKTKARELLQKANAIAPQNLFNKLYLAEVLLDQNENDRARELLQDILQVDGIRHDIAIDAFLKNQARALLAQCKE